MRFVLVLGLALLIGCGGGRKKCFECGITDQWAEAEARERAQREDAGTEPEGEVPAVPAADAGPDGA